MSEIVFLLEEESMRELLRELLPRVLPEGIPYRLVPHEGKTVNGARTIAPHLDPERNRSHSFGIFIAGLARVVSEMTTGPR